MLAVALAVGTLLATAACSDDGDDSASTDASAGATSSAGQGTATASPTPTPLTSAGAQTALITAGDLEDNWTQVQTAASWRNQLLIGTVDAAQFLTGKTQAADCQRLLDGLYDEDLLGPPPGPSALTGFTEGNSRLLYQVAAYQPASLDQSFDWLKSLPTACDQFNAVGSDGSTRTVQVVEASLPKSGDTRQGLTVTVAGPSGGTPVTLTIDVAVVRVGDDAITVTNGGTDGADHDSTETAVSQGTNRLKDVQEGRSPASEPSEFD
ncbi:hypothetical protein OG440_06260 [Streptomyces sp. NBC_00637]|uniref:hypothetical protein n=1 Tax=Streptomyces sp. NBC_00637 TaxID=2903667 RepID=UPI00324F2367